MKLNGEIRVINVQRGFGFISGSDRRDFFFHFNSVLKGTISPHRLQVGDRVEFNVVENEDLKKNPQAVEVAFVREGDNVTSMKLEPFNGIKIQAPESKEGKEGKEEVAKEKAEEAAIPTTS